jgi:hypothetical protein
MYLSESEAAALVEACNVLSRVRDAAMHDVDDTSQLGRGMLVQSCDTARELVTHALIVAKVWTDDHAAAQALTTMDMA